MCAFFMLDIVHLVDVLLFVLICKNPILRFFETL